MSNPALEAREAIQAMARESAGCRREDDRGASRWDAADLFLSQHFAQRWSFSDAKELCVLIKAFVLAEREACALAHEQLEPSADVIRFRDLIRARGAKP